MSGDGPKVSQRLRVFQKLAASRFGLRRQDIRRLAGLTENSGMLSVILLGETKARRIRARQEEDAHGVVHTLYSLTSLGRKHLESGQVDSWARELHLRDLGRGSA
jgi:hypothetical protein